DIETAAWRYTFKIESGQAGQEVVCGPGHALLLGGIDTGGGSAKALAVPVPYFDKGQYVAVQANDVDFTGSAQQVLGQCPGTLRLNVLPGPVLDDVAETPGGRGRGFQRGGAA